MSIQSAYRRMPDYLALPLALLVSAIVALALSILVAYTLAGVLERLDHYSDALGDGIFALFFVAPSVALLTFVSFFSIFVSWHRVTSWRAPTFAFVLGNVLVWVWAHDFGGIGFAWYVPGAVAWIVSCWLLRRKLNAHSEHVIEA